MNYSEYSFYIKPVTRLALMIIFAISSISFTFSWISYLSAFCLLISFIFFKTKPEMKVRQEVVFRNWKFENPFKGKTGKKHVGDEKEKEFYVALDDYLLYNATETKSAQHFELMKKKSDCVFAKKSQIWGSPDYNEDVSLDCVICYMPHKERSRNLVLEILHFNKRESDDLRERPGSQWRDCNIECDLAVWYHKLFNQSGFTPVNASRVSTLPPTFMETALYPTFLKFISCIQSHALDAFVIELPGHMYGSDIKVFGNAVRRALLALKTCDNLRRNRKSKRLYPETLPSDFMFENTVKWNSTFWVYEIHSMTFFITTFAPFYPDTNSRYNHGLPDCYILFQPELSFAIHDLPLDSASTNWRHPLNIRDRIRIAFHESGREYTPPMVDHEPMVYDMVKRIEPGDEQTIWWIDSSPSQEETDHIEQETQ